MTFRKYFLLVFIPLALWANTAAFCQVELALEGPEWKDIKSYEVKGRNGILIKQKLSFGDYHTTSVDRSWTKGYSSFEGMGDPGKNPHRLWISREYVDKNQTLFFALEDSTRNKTDVHCVSKFRSADLVAGNSGVSLSSIFGLGKGNEDLFYVQIYTSAEGAPWHLIIDNEALQLSPASYSTKLARSKDEYYILKADRTVRNNKGKVISLTFGSAGFQILNKNGVAVAAVTTINKGVVYLRDLPGPERIILASACAALLLQEQISTE